MAKIGTSLILKKMWIAVPTGAILMTSPSPAFSEAFLQVKGSDTMVNLVQRLAEVYMETHPETSIAITGGGSGTGIAALINGKADIANSSRAIKPKEVELARGRGIEPRGFVIAMDGLSVIVHVSNPVETLSVEQVGGIFRGEITHWGQLGGPDLPISMYGRQSNSGTFIYFRDHLVKGDYSPRVKRMNGNAQIVEAVRRDRGGIGYVGVGYIKDMETGRAVTGLKPMAISLKKGSAAAGPLDAEAMKSGEYPLTRPLFQYIDGKPGDAIRDFIRWETGKEGQRVAEEMGFFPITNRDSERNMSSLDRK